MYKWHSYITDFIRLTIRLFYFYNDYIYNGAKMLQQLSSLHKILHHKLLLKLQFGPTVGQVKLGSKCFFVEISMYIFLLILERTKSIPLKNQIPILQNPESIQARHEIIAAFIYIFVILSFVGSPGKRSWGNIFSTWVTISLFQL